MPRHNVSLDLFHSNCPSDRELLDMTHNDLRHVRRVLLTSLALALAVISLRSNEAAVPADDQQPAQSEAQTQPAAQQAAQAKDSRPEPAADKSLQRFEVGKWVELFDGKSLKGWTRTNFGGEGEIVVDIKKQQLQLNWGMDLTGITIDQKVPRNNYEIELECMRVDGSDFFCGLTFPIEDSCASLIVGGWGGGVCGISCLDRLDASENETTTYRSFDTGKWYPVRIRVANDRLEAWVEGKQIVDVTTKDREIKVRGEVELCQPLGLASWQTTAAVRKFRMRRIDPTKIKYETPEPTDR